jgi:ASC-1-like (ASCH) protein
MEFEMKLHSSPFSMIESGRKTIELRLYDEKRRQIAVGDTIRFSNIADPAKTILTEVKELYVFSSFEELYNTLPLIECGYTAETIRSASPKDMLRYYTPEQEEQYGVVGIRIEVQY